MVTKAAMTTGMEMTAKEHIKKSLFFFFFFSFTCFTTSGVLF